MRWNPPPTVLAQQSSLVPTELPDEAFPPSLVSMLIHMPSFSSSTCFRGEVMLKSSRHFRAGREEPRRCVLSVTVHSPRWPHLGPQSHQPTCLQGHSGAYPAASSLHPPVALCGPEHFPSPFLPCQILTALKAHLTSPRLASAAFWPVLTVRPGPPQHSLLSSVTAKPRHRGCHGEDDGLGG